MRLLVTWRGLESQPNSSHPAAPYLSPSPPTTTTAGGYHVGQAVHLDWIVPRARALPADRDPAHLMAYCTHPTRRALLFFVSGRGRSGRWVYSSEGPAMEG